MHWETFGIISLHLKHHSKLLFTKKKNRKNIWLFPSCRGVYWFHSVHPSVCPSVRPASRVCSVAPTVLVGSISYLHIWSSNVIRYVLCKVTCKIRKFEFFKICNFDFVLFWLGIWCESLVWVIMGQCVCVWGGGGGGGEGRGYFQNTGVLVAPVYSVVCLFNAWNG